VSTPVNDTPRYATDAPVHASDVYDRIEETAEFRELRRRFRSFVFPMTAAFLVWYLLYVFLSAWARGFMAHKVLGNINVAFVFGLLQFVSTFLIAWAYSRYANDKLDPLSGDIRSRIEREESR
jgi:uncharacterized membrane protein (DUF485 family)